MCQPENLEVFDAVLKGTALLKAWFVWKNPHFLEQMGYLGPFGKGGGWAAVVGWLSAGTAGKGTNLGAPEPDEKNTAGI